MNNNEVAQKIIDHLIAQGEQSVDPLTKSCAYRGQNGMACAVGCLISDEHYSPAIENIGVSYALDPSAPNLIALRNALERSGVELDAERVRLLREFQYFHDEILTHGAFVVGSFSHNNAVEFMTRSLIERFGLVVDAGVWK